MRILFVLLLTLPLQGCLFFFYIPGSVIDKLKSEPEIVGGNACAGASVRDGGRFAHHDGRMGTVEKIYGTSTRCPNPDIPMLVDVRYDDSSGPQSGGGK
jgi:hypothetical protein